jgi:uncharacterized protein YecT (DUF1311 family)
MTIIALALLLAAAAPCPGSSTREIEQCLAADLAKADAELNRYYAAATRRLTGEQQLAALAKLRSSERAWIQHRDAECDAVWEFWKGGTIRGTFSGECRLRLTRERTMAIWSNWLTYVDSTPPFLPKPIELD